jgi:hypothetical protein
MIWLIRNYCIFETVPNTKQLEMIKRFHWQHRLEHISSEWRSGHYQGKIAYHVQNT